MSDFYRSKLYDAERRAFANQDRVERTLEDCQKRAEWIAKNCKAWVLACIRYGHKSYAPTILDGGRGHTSWANSSRWDIKLTKHHQGNDWVIVHEMCHLPIPNAFQSHGREFAALYIEMTAELYGAEQAERLVKELERAKCVYERTEKYVKQLRGYFRTLARPDYAEKVISICVVTTKGKRFYGTPRLEDDLVSIGRSAVAGTPDTIPLDEVAYVTWEKHRYSSGRSWWS